VSGKICLGFAWENGAMQAMPTLGGPNAYAAGVNNRGQVVGWAETLVEGSTCNEPQVYDFHAVLWEPKRGTLLDLRPFPGDAASAATAINDRGQVVGISGDCDVAVGRWSARRAVMWDHGEVVEIPNLGGAGWHTPAAINDAGVVVGFSNPRGVTGGTLKPHAFLWRKVGGLEDLGGLPNSNDDNSQAFDVNARGDVVGVSCAGDACRAFVWENDVMYDLRELVDPAFEGAFLSARSINDRGEITGNVALPNGEIRAFIATPRPRP
jgi:probable HAF family extracellular repeat protein